MTRDHAARPRQDPHDGWTPEPEEQVQPGDPWRDPEYRSHRAVRDFGKQDIPMTPTRPVRAEKPRPRSDIGYVQCRAVSPHMGAVCDRPKGHDGEHRGLRSKVAETWR